MISLFYQCVLPNKRVQHDAQSFHTCRNFCQRTSKNDNFFLMQNSVKNIEKAFYSNMSQKVNIINVRIEIQGSEKEESCTCRGHFANGNQFEFLYLFIDLTIFPECERNIGSLLLCGKVCAQSNLIISCIDSSEMPCCFSNSSKIYLFIEKGNQQSWQH